MVSVVVILSMSLTKKGGRVFSDHGQRFPHFQYNIGTRVLNCACVINTSTPRGHEYT